MQSRPLTWALYVIISGKNCRLSEAEKMPQLRVQLHRFQKIYRYHITLLDISALELNKFNFQPKRLEPQPSSKAWDFTSLPCSAGRELHIWLESGEVWKPYLVIQPKKVSWYSYIPSKVPDTKEKERKKFEDYVEIFGEHRFNREVSWKLSLARII